MIAAPQTETSQGAKPGHATKPNERLDFKIPAAPLADALYAYTAATGLEGLAAGELLANRRSAEVRGMLTADEALQALLLGTGLVARFVDSGSFTLVPIQTSATGAAGMGLPSEAPRYAHYSALLQDAVRRALCGQLQTRPGDYRTAVQLWISPSGTVARSLLVGTTGDADRDRLLSELFSTLSIGAPPPAGLPQPAILLILPRSRVEECASAAGAGGP